MVDQLQSPQEEADTRILLHAKHHASDNEYNFVMIVSEDSDVYVLCIALATSIVPFYQIRGTKTRTRYLVQKLFH